MIEVYSATHLMSESTSPVDSWGTMEITVAAAATILAAYAAFHYVTANILQNHCNICRRSDISSACDVYLMLSHVRSTKHQFHRAAASLLSLLQAEQEGGSAQHVR